MSVTIDAPNLFPELDVECSWVTPLADVAARLSAGAPAVARIKSQKGKPVAYSVRKVPDGYELLNTANAKIYVVGASFASCDCGDANYRLRENGCCKHRFALRELLGEVSP